MDKVMDETELRGGDFVYVPPLDANGEWLSDEPVLAQVVAVVPPYFKASYMVRGRHVEACYHVNQASKDKPLE